MARPRNQEARRAQIVAAAAAAIAARGLIGLRVKDIAAQAGLSAGSVAYYYPEIDDLLVAVHEAAVTRFYRARLDAIAQCAGSETKVRTLVELGSATPTIRCGPRCTNCTCPAHASHGTPP